MQLVRDIIVQLALLMGRQPVTGSQFDEDLKSFSRRGIQRALNENNPWPFQRNTGWIQTRGTRTQTWTGSALTAGDATIPFTGTSFTPNDEGAYLWDTVGGGFSVRIQWVDMVSTTVYLVNAWPTNAPTVTSLIVIPGWNAQLQGAAFVGVRDQQGYSLSPLAGTAQLQGPNFGQSMPVPSTMPLSYLDSTQDTPPAPRTVQGVAVVVAAAQGVRTVEIGMAYQWGSTGPIGPISAGTSYSLGNLQSLTMTAPALDARSRQWYRVYYYRCPDLGWTDWRLCADGTNSRCPPNGGVTIAPDLSLGYLGGDDAGNLDPRWQPSHTLKLWPPPDAVYPMMITSEERYSASRWEDQEPIPGGSSGVGEVALLYAQAEAYTACGMFAEANSFSIKANGVIATALGQAKPRAADKPFVMGGVQLWRPQ